MLQYFVQLKEQPTKSERLSLARDTKVEKHIKIKDPESFNIPISINVVFLEEDLCDLWASINLMLLATFNKIKGLRMIEAEKLVGVADRTVQEAEGMLTNVQVEVGNYRHA